MTERPTAAITLLLFWISAASGCDQSSARPPSSAQLVVEPASISIDAADLGTSREFVATVRMWNTGEAPLHIYDLTSGCQCTIAKPDRMDIAPGEETTLRITVTPPAIGNMEKSVRIRTDSPVTPIVEIPVVAIGKALTPPYFVNRPPTELRLRTSVPGEFPEYEFELQTVETRHSSPWVLGLNSDSPGVVPMLLSTPEETDLTEMEVLRSYRFRLSGDGPSQPDAPTNARVTSAHSDEGASTPDAPSEMFVSVEFVPPLRVVPERISVAAVAPMDFPTFRQVLLIGNGLEADDWNWELAESLPDHVIVHDIGAKSGAFDN